MDMLLTEQGGINVMIGMLYFYPQSVLPDWAGARPIGLLLTSSGGRKTPSAGIYNLGCFQHIWALLFSHQSCILFREKNGKW